MKWSAAVRSRWKTSRWSITVLDATQRRKQRDVMIELPDQVSAALTSASDRLGVLQKVLELVLMNFRSETGTIHFLDPDRRVLQLLAFSGLPPAMLNIV